MAVTLTPLAATNTEAVTDGFLLLTGSALAVAIAVDKIGRASCRERV